ncbi:hypothetical protein GQ53DRAFT_330206 [Thozetella sp. PMI_491]|nr:hypothetical protein GQ53DRAFT_330206 [Thozetella sp. PMI_491]
MSPCGMCLAMVGRLQRTLARSKRQNDAGPCPWLPGYGTRLGYEGRGDGTRPGARTVVTQERGQEQILEGIRYPRGLLLLDPCSGELYCCPRDHELLWGDGRAYQHTTLVFLYIRFASRDSSCASLFGRRRSESDGL